MSEEALSQESSQESIQDSHQEINQEVNLAPEAHEDAGALSFDELDTLTDGRSGEELVKEAKQVGKEKTEKNEPPIEAESKSEKTEEASEEEIKEEIKRILARQGEEDLELYANTSFRHKVDGEEVNVELQELLNNYSGKVSYDRKFQEFSEKKKEFDSYKVAYDKDIEQIYTVIENFKNSMQNKDAMGALNYFANFAGMKPYEFREQMIRSLAPEVVRMSQMSEAQLLNERLQAENEYLLQQQESEQAKLKEQQAQRELLQEIKQIQEAHGISDEDFRNAYQELKESDYADKIDTATIAAYYVGKQTYSKATSILSQVNPSFTSDTKIVESLQRVIVENPSFDDNDLMDIVKEAFGNYKETASKTVSKKAKQPPKKQETKESQSKQDYLDWEDL